MKKISAPRLYINDALSEGAVLSASDEARHYLKNVLRLGVGDAVRLFNNLGDGEFLAEISVLDKKNLTFDIQHKTARYLPPVDISLAFALIKKAPLDYLIQKTTELGVGILQLLLTDKTVVRDMNLPRAEGIAIEAAEQCGLTALPEIRAPVSFEAYAAAAGKNILFCDESGTGKPILSACLAIKEKGETVSGLLIGPEGGFSERERERLREDKAFIPVSLGERIMRAETAAVAALAICNAIFVKSSCENNIQS